MSIRGQAGGRATFAKYGREHMSEIGKRGFWRTTVLYFDGDSRKHVQWLYRRGQWAIDRGLSYVKPTIYFDPGDHPAREQLNGQGVQDIREWLEHAENNMSS